MDENEIKELIKGWYNNKARNESDEYFKFLCLWICINTWLAHKSQKSTDKEMIDWLIQQNREDSDLNAAYSSISQTTSGQNALLQLASLSPITDSSGRRPEINIVSVYDNVNIIRANYRVRCNLFHGGKSTNNTRDYKLVKACNNILGRWLSELIASF